MKKTLDKANQKKAVITFLSEKISPHAFAKMQANFISRDTERTGKLGRGEFCDCMKQANAGDTDRVIDELM